MSDLANVVAVARREFTVRFRSRSYRIGTAVLVIGVIVFLFVPLIGQYLGRAQPQKMALFVGATDVATDPTTTLDLLLNTTATGQPSATPGYVVTRVTDLPTALSDVRAGRYSALLEIERASSGELAFTYHAADVQGIGTARTAAIVQQAANAVTVADRLDRLGISPADQGGLFAPAAYAVQSADPSRPTSTQDYMLGFGLSILIFTMIILYGQWVAMSVVEEKSSRVMEVILNAATPFQLLAGKVAGVGSLALVQFGAVAAAGALAMLAQAPIAKLVLGDGGAGVGLPAGLTLSVLLLLGVYGILGFLLYAVLYAAAGSLVSRQEDVNQAIMPMMLVSTAGYLVGVYSAIGLLDIRAEWLTVLAQVPFFSPFMMLSRVTAGQAAWWEVPLSIVLLVVGIVIALRVAARIYAAGVLLYGQRPGLRAIWQLFRAGT
jgi:ABC-2 type transport system permease protein